jgi:hypothetical protein
MVVKPHGTALVLLLLVSSLVGAPDCLSAQDTLPRVGVLDFEAAGISASEARIIGELFTAELVAGGTCDVLDRKNIAALLEEQELQASDCTDSSCALRIGQLLAADRMIFGTVGKLGDSYVINVQLLHVGTGKIEKSARGKFAKVDDAYDVIPEVVAELVGDPALRGGTAAEVTQRRPRAIFLDVGGGFVITTYEPGIEVSLGARYERDWHIRIGVGLGVLVGLALAPVGPRFGIDGYLYARPFPRLGFSLGFRGLPTYIGFGGGPTLGIHFDNLFVRVHVPIIYSYGFGLDAGYTF